MPLALSVTAKSFRLAEVFTISRGSKDRAEVLTVRITDGQHQGQHQGRGECVPYGRNGESIASVMAQINGLDPVPDRHTLQRALPPGAARNAVDCALWDLDAKRTGRRVWDLAGLDAPLPVQTAFTLSLDKPDAMEAAARRHAHRPLLKIKLGTPDDMPRLEAVRRGAPAPRIIVDANEGWSVETYLDLAPHLHRLGVALVEQPLPAGQDAALEGLSRPVPICADESCHDRRGLAELAGRYDMINIKLDKTGGLTEALALRAAARDLGLGIMVGCMVGSSLAMAPATLLAQGAALTDLDGPLLLAEDRSDPLHYDQAGVHPPDAALWG